MKYIKNLKMCYKIMTLLTFLYCPKLKLLKNKNKLYSITYNKIDFVKKLMVHKLCFSVLNYFQLI